MDSISLELPLPDNLGVEALNLATLQEAIDNVDQFQVEARMKLFKALAYHAIQPGTPTLDTALTALCSSAAYLLPDTPEYQLAQYAQHYRTMTEASIQMAKDVAQQQVEADLGEQFAEFQAHMRQGQLTEGAWCLVRLRTTLREAQQHQRKLQERARGAAEPDAAGGEVVQEETLNAAEAAASVAYTLELHCRRSEEALKRVLDAGCEALAHLLPSTHPHHPCSVPEAALGASAPRQGGAVFLSGVCALPAELLAGQAGEGGSQGFVEVKGSEIWEAASVQGELQARISAVSDMLVQGLLVPFMGGGYVLRLERAMDAASELPSPRQPSPEGNINSESEPQRPASRTLTHQGSSMSAHARSMRDGCTLIWEPASQQGGQAAASVETACLTLLKLLANIVFDLDEAMLKALGDALWPRLADAYVTHHVQPRVVAAMAEGAVPEGLVDAAAGLEEWAESCGLLEEPYLVPAVEAAVGRVLGAAQTKHVAAARGLLMLDLLPGQAGEPLLVGDPVPLDAAFYQRLLRGECAAWEAADPPCGVQATDGPLLARGRYRVGRGVVQVARLAANVLQEAAGSGNKVAARALVGSVHKFALLARELPCALPPSAAASLRGVPLLGFAHHNGLVHLADALLLLQATHAAELEALTEEPLGLVREALLLRDSAHMVLREQVTQHVQHLHELLAGMQGLRWVGLSGTAQAGIASRKAVAQVLHSMGRWGRTLVDALAPETIVEVCCQALAGICSTVVQDVMAKSDIGIDDCRELRDILGPLVADALPALIPSLPTPHKQHTASSTGADDPAGEQHTLSGVPVQQLRNAVDAGCLPLRKLRMLTDVLDAPMKQIVTLWERRKMQAVGFDAQEVEHLLTALFEESQHMRSAIARVRASARN